MATDTALRSLKDIQGGQRHTYPMKDMEDITVAKALYEGCICRFGASWIITTDQDG